MYMTATIPEGGDGGDGPPPLTPEELVEVRAWLKDQRFWREARARLQGWGKLVAWTAGLITAFLLLRNTLADAIIWLIRDRPHG